MFGKTYRNCVKAEGMKETNDFNKYASPEGSKRNKEFDTTMSRIKSKSNQKDTHRDAKDAKLAK